MLTETARRVREENVPTAALTLCRADVAALPLAPGSVDAMHAGAAMHCWPQLEAGLLQIRQALKPGGRFYASTFLQGAYGVAFPTQTGGGTFRFFEVSELEQLMADAGFAVPPGNEGFVRQEGRGCAIITAVVPGLEAVDDETEPRVAADEAAADEAEAEGEAPSTVAEEAEQASESQSASTDDAATAEFLEQME